MRETEKGWEKGKKKIMRERENKKEWEKEKRNKKDERKR